MKHMFNIFKCFDHFCLSFATEQREPGAESLMDQLRKSKKSGKEMQAKHWAATSKQDVRARGAEDTNKYFRFRPTRAMPEEV